MHKVMDVHKAIAGTQVGVTTSAGSVGVAKLTVLHKELTDALPKAGMQEIRVIIARLEPGDRTPYHSHRFPVTVYMLEGVFTLELDGRESVTINPGEVFVEPAHVRMTGRNLGTDRPAVMVLFYVSDPETPFADPV
jgi:quercetin dioxygenase-like cupin family protein